MGVDPSQLPSGVDPAKVIDMRWQTVVCPAHGEHLRVPVNTDNPGPILLVNLALLVIDEALANEGLIRAVDPRWDGRDGTANFDARKLNKIIAVRPLCYWVDRATLGKALTGLKILRHQRCDICGIPRLAGPYSWSMPAGEVQEGVVCVECALDAGERMHEAHPDGHVWPPWG